MKNRIAGMVVGALFLCCVGCHYDGPAETTTEYAEHPPTALKYKLIDYFGEVGEPGGIHYCDPLRHPEILSMDKSLRLADEEMGRIVFDEDEYLAIMDHLGLDLEGTITDFDVLKIYGEHHKLAAIALEFGNSDYLFQLAQYDSGQTNSGYIIDGTISEDGAIRVTYKALSNFACPKK